MEANKTVQIRRQSEAGPSNDLRTISTRICHDLYSPTNTIRMCLTLLEEEQAEDKVSREDLLATANGAVDELIGILDKMRFITDASTGKATWEWVDVESCFVQATQLLGTEGRGFVERIRRPSEWPSVYGVAAWIREIFSIFLRNAQQHAGADARVTVSWERHGHMLRFRVEDTGMGVPEPIRASLFRPFEQLHQYNDGRGLSLSIAHRLAKLQQGNCGYVGRDSGSLFYFELPVSAPPMYELEDEQ